MFPQDLELRFREGCLLQELGRLGEARDAYLDVLTTQDERHFSSVDSRLGRLQGTAEPGGGRESMGDLAEAERQWREVVREVPRYRQGWRGLGDVLIRMQRFAEADRLAAELLKDSHVRVEGLLLTSCLAQVRGRLDEVRGGAGIGCCGDTPATGRRRRAGAGSFSITARTTRPSGRFDR